MYIYIIINMTTFIYSTVFLENNCYRRGYVIEPSPSLDEPLYDKVRTINMPKVSPFKQVSSCGERYRPCVTAIVSFDGCGCGGTIGGLMRDDEIPELVNFLILNGYTINERLTKLMERRIMDDQKKLVFVCTYSNNNNNNNN